LCAHGFFSKLLNSFGDGEFAEWKLKLFSASQWFFDNILIFASTTSTFIGA